MPEGISKRSRPEDSTTDGNDQEAAEAFLTAAVDDVSEEHFSMDDSEESELSELQDEDWFEKRGEEMHRELLEKHALATAEELRDKKERRAVSELSEDDTGNKTNEVRLPTAGASELRERIGTILQQLSGVVHSRTPRNQLVSILSEIIQEHYGYNTFMANMILELFPPAEAIEYLESVEGDRPVTIRVNTLKTRRRDLVQTLTTGQNIRVERLEKWCQEGLQVLASRVPLAGTPEYLAGLFMLQSAVSLIPCLALGPQENENILDLAAAPGGKTTHIAALMRNTGSIVANDVNRQRIKALQGNLQRMGVENTIVCNYNGADDEFRKRFPSAFDRVLLDAPCTGTGIASRDPTIKHSKEFIDVQRLALTQRNMLLNAIDCCRHATKTKPGTIVYSTCSILIEENEAVIDYALRNRHVEVVDLNHVIPFGRPGLAKYRTKRFHPHLIHAKRFYPHRHNVDGFFVCVLRKYQNGSKQKATKERQVKPMESTKRLQPIPDEKQRRVYVPRSHQTHQKK